MRIESCGSFFHHGLYGSTDDLLTRCYLASAQGEKYPDAIEMSRNVFEYYVRRAMMSQPMNNPAASTMAELAVYFSTKDDRAFKMRVSRLYDAEVSWSTDIPSGTARFYIGGELVGETLGWIA